MLSRFICVWLFAVLWTIACQSLSMGLPRQECWSGLPCHAPGDFPWSKLVFLMPPALAGGFFMQLRNHILLSERSQPEKFTYCLIPTIWHFGKGTELLDGHKKELLHGSILVEACGLENNWRWALFSCTFIWLFKFLVQSLSHVWLFATPWTAACQACLSFTIFWSLLTKFQWTCDAVQPSPPLSSTSPPAFYLSQH